MAIWVCLAHTVKSSSKKLDSRTEVCLFIGYPKGSRGGLFYIPQDKKVFVLVSVTLIENDYMINFKPHSKVVLEELQGDVITPQPTRIAKIMEEENTTSPN